MRRVLMIVGSLVAAAAVALPASSASAAPSWTVVPSPNVTLAYARLAGVSCLSTTSCVAVGDAAAGLLAATWDGTTWSSSTPVQPTGRGPQFTAVSCVGGTCMAVGEHEDATTGTALAETYANGVWSLQPVPAPPNTTVSALTAVSCAAADACTALGKAYSTDSNQYSLLAERWSGGVWTIQPTATPTVALNYDELGLSCPTVTFCLAAGFDEHTNAAFAQRWDATAWSNVTIPQPGGNSAYPRSISCNGPSHCQVVGIGSNGSGLLAERWDGTAFTIEPVDSGGDTAGQLNAVSCATATSCRAIGSTRDAYRWNGTSWTRQSLDPPPDYGSPLQAISCPTVGTCEAVGQRYEIGTPTDLPRALGLAGNNWHDEDLSSLRTYADTALSTVSCLSATDCAAVGSVTGGDGKHVMAMNWDGTRWALTYPAYYAYGHPTTYYDVSCTPAGGGTCVTAGWVYGKSTKPYYPLVAVRQPTGTYYVDYGVKPRVSPSAQFFGSSCAPGDTRFCVAVGTYTDRHGVAQPLVNTYTDVWRLASSGPVGPAEFTHVSCASPTFCLTLAHQDPGGGATLAERWDGTNWTLVAAPPNGNYTGISCTGATACVAVGNGDTGPVVATWDGTAWTAQSVTLPGNVTAAALSGVSCTTICWAVGSATTTTGAVRPFAVKQRNGWTGQVLPQPTGSSAVSLNGVGCLSATACTAVGAATVNGVVTTLVERLG